MEDLSGKAACHLYANFKQCLLSTFFPSTFYRNAKLSLYYTKGWQQKGEEKSTFLFKHKRFNPAGGSDFCWVVDPPLCSSSC